MAAKTDNTVTPFGKRPAWNIFDIFDEMPRAKQATIEMKTLCDQFFINYNKIANKYSKEGLSDSASRDMVVRYLLEQLEPWRKAHRVRQESGMKPLPYRK